MTRKRGGRVVVIVPLRNVVAVNPDVSEENASGNVVRVGDARVMFVRLPRPPRGTSR